VTAGAGPAGSAGGYTLSATEIAAITGGTVFGDGERRVRAVAPLNRAGPDHLSFLADKRYASLLSSSQAGVVLLSPEFAEADTSAAARITVDRPYDALVHILPRLYAEPVRPAGVHPSAVVAASARLGVGVAVEAGAVIGEDVVVGDRAWIGPLCVVERGVRVGADTRLVAQVTCYRGCVIGDRTVIHAGARLGADGFGYAFADGAHQKIPHVGGCVIGDDVEIGANTCIDRGSVDDTVVGSGTKIDNLVHLAHNVQVGRLCLIMAQVGVAGSTHIDDGAILAGQAGLNGHITIGRGARIAAQAGVFSDVPPGESWSGYPARPHHEALRASAALYRLTDLLKRIERFLDDKA
jgi:UDP-3-O-[3-hydroxymyristoyl] glucosamine N-acyltransferase